MEPGRGQRLPRSAIRLLRVRQRQRPIAYAHCLPALQQLDSEGGDADADAVGYSRRLHRLLLCRGWGWVLGYCG